MKGRIANSVGFVRTRSGTATISSPQSSNNDNDNDYNNNPNGRGKKKKKKKRERNQCVQKEKRKREKEKEKRKRKEKDAKRNTKKTNSVALRERTADKRGGFPTHTHTYAQRKDGASVSLPGKHTGKVRHAHHHCPLSFPSPLRAVSGATSSLRWCAWPGPAEAARAPEHWLPQLRRCYACPPCGAAC